MYNVSFPGLGIENLKIDRTIFSFGSFELYWYGVLITVAVLVTMFLASRHAPKYGIKSDDVYDYFLALIPSMIIFARLYYVVFAWDEFDGNIARILDTRSGGLAFYGGVIGGVLAFMIVSRVKKIRLSNILDFLVVYVPLGQAIGRWGNFFNQEAFGTNTDLPWGMISEGTRNYLETLNQPGLDPFKPVHPTFLYEFIGNLIIFGILLLIRRNRRYRYQVMAAYLGLYGVLRFFVEGIRTDALYIGKTSIRVSQVLSLVMVAGAILYAVIMHLKMKREQTAYEESRLMGDTEATPPTRIAPWEDRITETEVAAADADAPTEIEDRPKMDASTEIEDASKADAPTEIEDASKADQPADIKETPDANDPTEE